MFSLCGGNTSVAAEQNLTNKQTLFLQAEKALRTNDLDTYNRLYRDLADYPLQEYLQRELLIKKLKNLSVSAELTSEINSFLNSYNNQPVSRKLRYQWLRYLAATKQPEQFLKFYQSSSSVKLKCLDLQFRLEKKGFKGDIYPEIESIWLTGRSLPKDCDPLIKLWKKSGGLSNALLWQRMLLAADQKQYRLLTYLNRQRVKSSQNTGELLLKITKRPQSLLQTKFKSHINQQGQTVIFRGLNKLAWKNPAKAIKAWKKFDQRLLLSSSQTETLKRSIGLSLAIEQDPQAKNWLLTLKNEQDSSVDQWLLSSALNTRDWSLIEYVTRQKKYHSIDVDKWRYWRAISTKHRGFDETSDWLLKSLANNRSYYGFLAAIDQKIAPQLNINQKSIAEELLVEISSRKNAINAREFYQLGRLTEARSEWNSLITSSPSSELVAIAQIAHSWGWDHQSILAFAKSKQIDDIAKRFPFYQKDLYLNESNKHRIPISWAYAITRQESAFKADASSSAGAHGLMQLTPSTASLVAKRQSKSNRINYKNKYQLLTPEINIKLGIAHLREMLDYYKGHPILATAAYNAGQHRVDMWLTENAISDSILWIEQIPYKETREYVKNVLTYQQIYSQLSNTSESFLSNLSQYPIPTNSKSKSQLSAH